MKTSIVCSISLVFGGAASLGFLAGYIYQKRKYDKILKADHDAYDNRVAAHDKELSAMRAICEKLAETDPGVMPAKDMKTGTIVSQSNDKFDINKKLLTSTIITPSIVGNNDRLDIEKKLAEEKERANSIASQYQTTISKEEGHPSPRKSDIYILTEAEFANADPDTTRSLTFYRGDHILADADNNMISNVLHMVGPERMWNIFNDNVDTVYVQNDITGETYEIIKDDGRWDEVASPTQRAIARSDAKKGS